MGAGPKLVPVDEGTNGEAELPNADEKGLDMVRVES